MTTEQNASSGYNPDQSTGTAVPPVAPAQTDTPVLGDTTSAQHQLDAQVKKSPWRIFWRVILILSIIANVAMFFMLIALGAVIAMGDLGGYYKEQILSKNSFRNKIAVIRIEGIIEGRLSEQFCSQLEMARKDKSVKAVIIRTISPGGSVAASDQIHHQIVEFRQKTNKPVVAFMQTVAASGGYYTSVACDNIVAEPTAITGSIGVLMNHLVIKQLLEEKLGISPVVLKSGEKKDWPSLFSETTEEQKKYLYTKLIQPTYERFVSLVQQGRNRLSIEEVRTLADGSIYLAEEAKEKGLIDQVGYFDDAVTVAKSLAHISDATVVEYVKPSFLSDLLGAQNKSPWLIDQKVLDRLMTPQLLYLWDGR